MPASQGETMREYVTFFKDASSGNISNVREVPYREPFIVSENKLY